MAAITRMVSSAASVIYNAAAVTVGVGFVSAVVLRLLYPPPEPKFPVEVEPEEESLFQEFPPFGLENLRQLYDDSKFKLLFDRGIRLREFSSEPSPDIPQELVDAGERPCPFWRGKKVKHTHCWALLTRDLLYMIFFM